MPLVLKYHVIAGQFRVSKNTLHVDIWGYYYSEHRGGFHKAAALWHLSIKTKLAGVGVWTECQPVSQKVAGSIPSQGIKTKNQISQYLGGGQ